MRMPEPGDDSPNAEALIRDLKTLRGIACADCNLSLCNHHVLISIGLGFKDSARCLQCLGLALETDPGRLLESIYSYIKQRDCYRTAWEWAGKTEGVPIDSIPSCLEDHRERRRTAADSPAARGVPWTHPRKPEHQTEWDAGDMACGDLVLELRLRLQAMKPGQILKVRARDPGAPEDLPAWCRLTGHTLMHAQHPNYSIRRKE